MPQSLSTPRRRINVRAIIYKDGKLLAVTHKAADSRMPRYYFIPGGGLDPHESLIDGVKRELLEETGVVAKVGKLLFVQQFASERAGYTEELEFFFEVTNASDFERIDLSATTHGGEELSVCEFVDPAQVELRPAFLQDLDIASYLDSHKPVYVSSRFI